VFDYWMYSTASMPMSVFFLWVWLRGDSEGADWSERAVGKDEGSGERECKKKAKMYPGVCVCVC
jgi:hypothetical protein